MYNFKDIATSLGDVPDSWIYEHYLEVREPMNGSVINMRSFINSDTTPSLFLYVKDGKYKWKDFSSGKSGSAIDVVIEKNKISYKKACAVVISDYNKFLVQHGKYIPTTINSSVVDWTLHVDYDTREWDERDRSYWWGEYGIPQRLLEVYNVKPLRWYELSKTFTTYTKSFNPVSRSHIYGYFKSDGTLYQIYQPKYPELKFIKVANYIQGFDQLERKVDTLIIGSSLKDIMVLESLSLNIETIAPLSETTYLGIKDIQKLKTDYKYVFTLFDNDKPGIRAMKHYKSLYEIDYVHVPFYKDIAEYRKNTGWDVVKSEITIRIDKKLNNE